MKALQRTFNYLRPTHWCAALGIGMLISVLIPLETLHLNAFWLLQSIIYRAPLYAGFACVFLVAIGATESGARDNRPSLGRYFTAALAASIVCIGLALSLSDWTPQPPRREVRGGTNTATRYVAATNTTTAIFALGFDGVLHCSIAMFIYVRLRNAHLAARALARAQFEGMEAHRKLAEARLAAARSRIDPEVLSGALENIERSYRQDPARADALLDELIEFLRAAIPRVRDDDERLGPVRAMAVALPRAAAIS